MAPFGELGGGTALLARWTTDWDCKNETSWWYVIKDTPFDISSLKAKRRYEITKGRRNFTVIKIDPVEHKEELYKATVAAYQGYDKKYRPSLDHSAFIEGIDKWRKNIIYAAFSKEDNVLAGYALLTKAGENLNFNMLKTYPEYEKSGVNAAIIAFILEDNEKLFSEEHYLVDGSRNVSHETGFQDYLEKYFGFRKAYCKLHIKYRKPFNIFIEILYRLRKPLRKLDSIGMIHNVNSLLAMEEVVRN